MPLNVINRFAGEYRWLSNFWACRPGLIHLHYGFCGEYHHWFPSVEHGYQASKTHVHQHRDFIRQQCTAGQAKRFGQELPLREDWHKVRVHIMTHLVRQKFKDPGLAQLLLATGDAKLVEGNTWGDSFWGVCNNTGQNHLGIILELVRWELQEDSSL